MTRRKKIVILIGLAVILCASAAGADDVRLQFRLEVGKKQTMRITSRMASTPPGQPSTQRLWILTLELEPRAVAADGAVTLRVTMRRIQHQIFMGREGEKPPVFAADSADEKRRYEHEMGICLAPIGESFTVVVSPQGRIGQLDTEAFCAAVGRKRMEYEDEAIRRKATSFAEWKYRDRDEATRRKLTQELVDREIRSENRKYGSAAERQQQYRAGALESHLYSMVRLPWLLHDLLMPFPAAPVAQNGRWTAPVMTRSDGPLELTGTYTLKGQEGGACIIQVEARRTMDHQCYGAPAVPEKHRTRLAGTYQATLKIDRTTGTLLSGEAVMDLKGQTSTYMPGLPTEGTILQIAAKSTTTVETVY